MQTSSSTTPFGRRPFSLALMASQVAANDRPPETIVHKWQVFDAIRQGRGALCVSDRSLAVLYALLTFHPETMLGGADDIVVFPSNRNLVQRANGMAEKTLRRHLAALVECGVVIRRDSPNGKRYARKGEGGEIEKAFGFDLTPIVARAAEFQRLAAEAKAEEQVIRHLRERIAICRRDIDKMIATGSYEGVPADWNAFREAYKRLAGRRPRTATLAMLEPLASELETLMRQIRDILEAHVKTNNMSGNAGQNDRQIQNSNPKAKIESELSLPEAQAETPEPQPERSAPQSGWQASKLQQQSFPLGMVLEACPDIVDHARDGIKSWRDLVATAALVCPMLDISPSAWEDANEVLGPNDAAVVLAAILQRSSAITSAGGYLRSLTEKARGGAFSLGPVLMALINTKLRDRGRKRG
jgi:replication initiation protein RepC